ncbi:MAG TPA: hypothetical protein VKE42_12235 [Candidatus Cybelea sp.]|nr:hypothetical protein [Candidatus Cybelea sp.]
MKEKPRVLVDPECLHLAQHFLADEPYTDENRERQELRVKSLAGWIQTAVEDWFEDHPALQQPRR